MATGDDGSIEVGKEVPNNTITVADENMNDPPARAFFGRKYLKRRSSLFFKGMNGEISDSMAGCCNRVEAAAEEEQQIPRRRSSRRVSTCASKSMYRTRSNASKGMPNFEVTCEPPPVSLKPILLSVTQNAARRISRKAKGWNVHKHVRFRPNPNVHEISPRSGKVPGVVKMPDSPPANKNIATSEVATDDLANSSFSSEIDVVQKEDDLLQKAIVAIENGVKRFLPVEAEIIRCDAEVGLVLDEGLKDVVDKTDEVVEGIAIDMVLGHSVENEDLSDIEAINKPMPPTRAKQRVEPNITWIRGDRLRSIVKSAEEKTGENKENADSKSVAASLKKTGEVNNRRMSVIDSRHTRPSIFDVPHAGPNRKVREWLKDMPENEGVFPDINDGTQNTFKLQQQQRTGGENKIRRDAFDILMKRESSPSRTLATKIIRSGKKQDNKEKCRRRSLWLHKAVDELPASKRRQTIVMGQVIESNTEEGTSSSVSIPICPSRRSVSAVTLSAYSIQQNVENVDDDVMFLCQQRGEDFYRKSLSGRLKTARGNTGKTASCGSGTVAESAQGSNDQMVLKRECARRHKKKYVFAEEIEVDCAPFPSISNVGYAETAAVNYNLPCSFRSELASTVSSCPEYSSQMMSSEQDHNEIENMQQNAPNASCAESKIKRKRKSQWNARSNSAPEELEQNTWSEALRPRETNELATEKVTVREICEWIEGWKKRLLNSRNRKSGEKVTTKGKRCDSDLDDSFDSDDCDDLCTTAVVYGPSGSGKTSLVYVVAQRYGMHVLEVASNEKRDGAQLKSKLQGAAYSHKFSVAAAVSQMFSQSAEERERSVEDSLIVIDDCDVIYEKHDDGFWQALKSLCREARTPIIITCEDVDFVRQELGSNTSLLTYELTRPQPHVVASRLQRLCTAINVDISPDICTALADEFNCDLRACINHLQFYLGDSSEPPHAVLDHWKREEQIKFEVTLRKHCSVSYNVIIRCNHSYEPGSNFSQDEGFETEESELDLVKTRMHEAVKVTRNALPAAKYFPLPDVVLDYVPYLCIMNEAFRAKMPPSRRALHYFDELHGDLPIDPTGKLKISLSYYSFLNV